MKYITVLIVASVLCVNYSQAQFKVNMGAGVSFGHSAIVEGGVGYHWNLIDVSANAQVHTTNKVKDGAVFELRIGHSVDLGNDWAVLPFIGPAYHYNSSDLKGLNIGRPLAGLELSKMFREDIGVYGSFVKTGRLNIVSIGVRGFFN